jgi:amino-acid N-acetyltransferase
MTIGPMHREDREAVHALLRSCGLPLDGFDEPIVTAIVARDATRVAGSAALELYPPYALLRSVAVKPSYRGRGLGQFLTAEALALARARGIGAVYLLTETAAGFFPRFGFRPVTRETVPLEVRQSVEFQTACPSTAQAFELRLASRSGR